MKATELKSESLKKEYTVVIPAADFEKEVDAKINQIAKTTKIPGFRPGKAPKEMLKQKYRASVLGEVLDETVRNATEEVIKSNKLNPVMMPNIKVTKFEDGKDIEFTLTVELMPEIKIGDLSAIKLEKLMAEVPAEEVEKALNYIAQSRRETVKVEEDRAAAKGDTVVIDFTGSIDGVEFQGGKGNNYPLELGSNSFIPGFEDQLIGKKTGDKVDVNVTFPENYHAKDLAGKASVFAVEIKELRAAKEVEINDEFAKSLGEESLDKLKAAIAERIKGDYEAASKMKLKRQLLDNLDNEYKFDVPAGLVDAEYKSIVDQYEQAKKYNQLDESEKNKSEEELLAEYKDIAVRRVKLGLLLSEIGKDAKVTITPDDINKAIMNEAKKYPGQEKAVFDYYLNFIPYFANLFSPLFVFIAVIFFTSKLAENSEIIAMFSTGMSFKRMLRPYMVSAAIIAITTFCLGSYVIPKGSVTRLNFEDKYYKPRKSTTARNIQLEVDSGVIAYIERFEDYSKTGYRFSLDKFKDKQLVSHLTARSITYDTAAVHKWKVKDYMIREMDGMRESIVKGERLDTILFMEPADFLIMKNQQEMLTSPQLSEYIDRQRQRGFANIKEFEIEYHKRIAMSFASFILTLIGVSLSSKKTKGGMGLHLGIGLGLSFSYILFQTIASTFAVNGNVPPVIAVWIPNLLYAFIAFYLYKKAPK